MSSQSHPDPDFKWPEPTEEDLRQRRKELIAKIKQAESDWPKPQPIETAPKDTPILVYDPASKLGWCSIASPDG